MYYSNSSGGADYNTSSSDYSTNQVVESIKNSGAMCDRGCAYCTGCKVNKY